MKIRNLPLIIAVVFSSCTKHEKRRGDIDYPVNSVTFTSAARMKYVTAKGVDSYVAYLVNQKNDTFHVEYGKKGIINDLYEIGPTIFDTLVRSKILARSEELPLADQAVFSS